MTTDPAPEIVVLSDPHRIKSDCNMIRRAVKAGWLVPQEKRPEVVKRLLEIVDTREHVTADDTGADAADRNAIAAARVLVAMTGENQADLHHVEDHNQRERHHADQMARAPAGTTVNVGVQVGLSDSDRIRIAVEAGLTHLLPPELAERAKELESH
jgi:hypothetical protein